jgi:putative SOS response-associated peptidase YedK
MCNAYEIGRRVSKNPLKNSLLLAASLDLPTEPRLIRRTDSAPVVTADGKPVTMRWGFERPTLGTINNSREDKLQGPMWSKAFRERRCVIPASAILRMVRTKGKEADASLYACRWRVVLDRRDLGRVARLGPVLFHDHHGREFFDGSHP